MSYVSASQLHATTHHIYVLYNGVGISKLEGKVSGLTRMLGNNTFEYDARDIIKNKIRLKLECFRHVYHRPLVAMFAV